MAGRTSTSPARSGHRRARAWAAVAASLAVAMALAGIGVQPTPAGALVATQTYLYSSLNPSGFGDVVVLTAVPVAQTGSSNPTSGTVTFLDGSQSLGTVTLDPSGVASVATASLSLGSHLITARYNGNSAFAASTSSLLTQTVHQQDTATYLYSAFNPVVAGQPAVLLAVVDAANGAATPTGSIEFFADGESLGVVPLDNTGAAELVTDFPASGTSSLTVVYTPGPEWITSSADPVTQLVIPATTTTVTSSANPAQAGQLVTFTATVRVAPPDSGVPTGTVTFTDNDTPITGCTSTAVTAVGTARCQVVFPSPGTHPIGASYDGAGNFGGSDAAVSSETVGPCTTLSISSTPLRTARVRAPYADALSACGGTRPYKWKKLTKLPRGLKLGAKTGVISGTPKVTGTSVVTVQVTDSKKPKPKSVATRSFTLVVT